MPERLSESWHSNHAKLLLDYVPSVLQNEFLLLLFYRTTLALLTRSTFVPDETFQFVEPAFRVVHGVGIQTWEWTLDFRIRSFVPLLPLILVYKVLAFANVDSLLVAAAMPRILQAVVAAFADYSLVQIARRIGGEQLSKITLAVQLGSWSLIYCMQRTLANCFETSFFLIGVHMLIIASDSKFSDRRDAWHTSAAVALSALSLYVRPTSALLWIPTYTAAFYYVHSRKRIWLAKRVLVYTTLVVQACVLLDSWFYGAATVPPLRFLHYNVGLGVAQAFGVKTWHWYFSHGLPTMLGLYTPVALVGCCRLLVSRRKSDECLRLVAALSVVYPVLLSLATPHKEVRFLLPVLPLLHLVVADQTRSLMFRYTTRCSNRHRAFAAFVVLISHCSAGLYMLTRHQVGTDSAYRFVAHHMRATAKSNDSAVAAAANSNVVLAAPCYSFAGYAQLHTKRWPVRVVAWHCGLRISDSGWITTEESASFDSNPAQSLKRLLETSAATPATNDYVLTFDAYDNALLPTLQLHGFVPLQRFHHADFRYDLDDPYCKRQTSVYWRGHRNP